MNDFVASTSYFDLLPDLDPLELLLESLDDLLSSFFEPFESFTESFCLAPDLSFCLAIFNP